MTNKVGFVEETERLAAMSYKTLLVHLQSGQSNSALLTVAGQFASRFEAHVIGIAACQPMMVVSGDGMVCGDVYTDDQRQITADLETAQAEFRDALRSIDASLGGDRKSPSHRLQAISPSTPAVPT